MGRDKPRLDGEFAMSRDREAYWAKELEERIPNIEKWETEAPEYEWLTENSDRHGGTEFTRHRNDRERGLHRFVSVYVSVPEHGPPWALVEVHASVSDEATGDFRDRLIASEEMDDPHSLTEPLRAAFVTAEAMTRADLDERPRLRPRAAHGL
ncbi:hypothetical protein ACFVXW_07450 [Streptomyces sp. NPDC058251]|uniref:hypothetical protein n=1 Tax=Streptomyces sp. NPDC058251 TaxID=3346404 RepID=UPI0036E5EC5F